MPSPVSGLHFKLDAPLDLGDHYACPACAVFCSGNSCGEQAGGKG